MIQLACYLGIEMDEAGCWKCRVVPGDGDWNGRHGLQRAHVIDRFLGGLDTLANFRPLCIPCHRLQPIFEPGQEEAAIAWFDDSESPLDAIIATAIARHRATQ